MKMKYLLIAILLLGACSAQYFNQEEVEASFENDFGDLDAMTKDMDFDEENLLEDAQDEEDPFDMYDDTDDDEFDRIMNADPESDFLAEGEEENEEGMEDEGLCAEGDTEPFWNDRAGYISNGEIGLKISNA